MKNFPSPFQGKGRKLLYSYISWAINRLPMDLISFLKSKKLFTDEECITIDAAFDRAVLSKGTVIQSVNMT